MRIIIRDIIDPAIKRQENDRQDIFQIKKKLDTIETRLDDIDWILNKTDTKSTKWDSITKQLNVLESNISIRHNETHHRIAELDTSIEFYEKKFENLQELTSHNNINLNKVQEELTHTNDKIVKAKEELLQTVNSQWSEIVDLNHKTDNKINELRNLSEKSINISTENNTTIEMVQNILKDLQEVSDRNKVDIIQLFKSKVDSES